MPKKPKKEKVREICDLCGLTFASLANHMHYHKINIAERENKCDKCGQAMPHKNALE